MGEVPGSFSTCGGVNESVFVFLGYRTWQVALLVIPGKCTWNVPVWSLQDSPVLSTSVPRRSHSCSVSSRDFVSLASWRSSPPLAVLFFLLLFLFFFRREGVWGVFQIKFTDKTARQQAGENYKLSMEDLFVFSTRSCLVLQRGGRKSINTAMLQPF